MRSNRRRPESPLRPASFLSRPPRRRRRPVQDSPKRPRGCRPHRRPRRHCPHPRTGRRFARNQHPRTGRRFATNSHPKNPCSRLPAPSLVQPQTPPPAATAPTCSQRSTGKLRAPRARLRTERRPPRSTDMARPPFDSCEVSLNSPSEFCERKPHAPCDLSAANHERVAARTDFLRIYSGGAGSYWM